MSFTSYAQNYEDVMLWRCFKEVPQGCYIDVGAAWPVSDSVTKAFYDAGWNGINVEPNPRLHAELEKERPRDANLRCAVGASAGSVEMFFFENEGLSTAVEDVANVHRDNGMPCTSETVQVRTLDDIWTSQVPDGQAVHFLKIDVEGMEREVLEGNDWQRHRPIVVLMESFSPMTTIPVHEEWEHVLVKAGYLHAYSDGVNRFYLEATHGELLPCFRYPPNVWDRARKHAELALARQRDELLEMVERLETRHPRTRLASVAHRIRRKMFFWK